MNVINQLLLDLGITPDNKGFDYICLAVSLIQSNKEEYRQITKSLYPDIANKSETTPSKVERNIRYAVSKAIKLDHGEMKTLIGLDPYKNKVCNSEFLFSLAYAVSEHKEEK